jgi:hypothetical protein
MIAGYGPWCLKKMKEQEEAPPEGQTTIDDYITNDFKGEK